MARTIRIASAQYPIDELTSMAAFDAKLARWVEQAVVKGAQLLVFPEYASMELARIAGRHISRDLHASIEVMQYCIADYEAKYASLAKRHGVHILAGSAPTRLADGSVVNRARLFTPHGETGSQQKQILTRSEVEDWGIDAGSGLCVFDIGLAKIGIAICYDSEFPLIVRAMCDAGAEVILVPSCTDTAYGYYRVRNACAARALENQVYVVQACTVGAADWSAAVDQNAGAAGFFAPSDPLFSSPSGVLEEGQMNAAQWVFATLDLDLLAEVRKDGDVFNTRDWDKQPGAAELPPAKVVTFK
ncbi:carbon-nitrogen hydrolase family protein [Rhodomicrobium lacus]|uniref:carbon-nitrogen hydrolase family protein n=1 Tax=Rhodomicrobium lacus TaxID=2498452 RepID=UPI0026E47829|nr:carbon-nitrogen hydrolase family protein [Rhodomicrobium lacus]WKW52442.1 carbon-nitrogen hydrolase family protein [Rhodomicrobium lacus]